MKNKIICSILAIIAIVAIIFFLNIDKKEETDLPYMVYVELRNDENGVIHELTIDNESLVEALDKQFDIIIKDGMLLKIDFLESLDTSNYFIKIEVNGSFSTKGINNIVLKNNDRISFIYTKVY